MLAQITVNLLLMGLERCVASLLLAGPPLLRGGLRGVGLLEGTQIHGVVLVEVRFFEILVVGRRIETVIHDFAIQIGLCPIILLLLLKLLN